METGCFLCGSCRDKQEEKSAESCEFSTEVCEEKTWELEAEEFPLLEAVTR
jgi:hypothetical protein